MSHRPLSPLETVSIIQAAIEGLNLIQVMIRDKMVEKKFLPYDQATAYVRRLKSTEQYADIYALFSSPEEDADFRFIKEVTE